MSFASSSHRKGKTDINYQNHKEGKEKLPTEPSEYDQIYTFILNSKSSEIQNIFLLPSCPSIDKNTEY